MSLTDTNLRAGIVQRVVHFGNECMRRTVATLVQKGKFEQADGRISRLIVSGLVTNMCNLLMWSIRRAKPHLVDYLVHKIPWVQLAYLMEFYASDTLPLTLYPRFPLVGNLAIVDVIATVDILVQYGINVLHSHCLMYNTTSPGQRLLVDCWRKYILDFSSDAKACRQQLSTSGNTDDHAFLADYDGIQSSVGQALNQVLSSVSCFPCPVIAICAAYDTTFDRQT